jgi:hypothetical protein
MANILLQHTRFLRQENGTGTDVSTYNATTNPYGIRIINNSGTAIDDVGNAFKVPVTNVNITKGVGVSSEPRLDISTGDPEPTAGSTDALNIEFSCLFNLGDTTVNAPVTFDYNHRDVLGFLFLMSRTKGLIKLYIDDTTTADSNLLLLKSLPVIYNPQSSDVERGTAAAGGAMLPSAASEVDSGVNYGPYWVRVRGFSMSNTPDTRQVQGTISFTVDLSYTST